MKSCVNRVLGLAGLRLARVIRQVPPATRNRPMANRVAFFEDLKARGFAPKAILDGGANHGNWTRDATQAFPDAWCLMVEPQIELKSALESMCKANPRISFVLGGLAGADGQLVLNVCKDTVSSSFVHGREASSQRSVPVYTLDSLISHWGRTPDFLKLDIEGLELEALKKATSCLGTTELILVEANLFGATDNTPLARDLVQFLGSSGYELYDIVDYLRRPLDGALWQLDLVFARSAGQLRRSSRYTSFQAGPCTGSQIMTN